MLYAGVDWGFGVVDQAARKIFGDDAVPAKGFMDGFLAEKRRAERELPTSNEQHRTLTALVNWSIRTFVQAAKVDAALADQLAKIGNVSDRIENCWRFINSVQDKLNLAYADRDGYRQRIDTVDAVVEQLLSRIGLVAKFDGEARLTLVPAGNQVVLDDAIAKNATSALLIPLKKKKTGGWPKGKKRSRPVLKAAAKLKPAKKKARRKSK